MILPVARSSRLICRLCHSPRASVQARFAPQVTLYACPDCGIRFADHAQDPQHAEHDHFRGLDLTRYFRSVKATRQRSYQRLLCEVRRHVAAGTWLDVGCSYGWLLAAVQEAGFCATGIEPSQAAAARARECGAEVREGLFPEVLAADERFHVISFMDVLEHLPNPRSALAAAREHLAPGGIIVIQVPDQRCWLYWLAEQMFAVSGGSSAFALRRLWLAGFDFPHLYYFTESTLARVLAAAGLRAVGSYRSPIGSPREAIDRVRYAEPDRAGLGSLAVGLAVGAIHAVDALSGTGGLLTVLARPL